MLKWLQKWKNLKFDMATIEMNFNKDKCNFTKLIGEEPL